MEHHSNIVPWYLLAEEVGAELDWVPVDDEGRLDMTALDGALERGPKLIAVAHVSNVLGTVNPIADIVRLAHDAGAIAVVDGAQAAPKLPLDLAALGADFYGFTGHKLYGPTGVGVLYGRAELLEAMPPYEGGGSMIRKVTKERITWADVPARFEAGTPPIAEAIGLAAAVEWLDGVGLDAAHAHEAELAAYALERLADVPGLRVFGPPAGDDRVGIVSFEMEGVHAHDVSEILDRHAIAVRAGHHCAQVAHGSPRRRRDHPRQLRRLQHPRGDRPAGRRPPRRPPSLRARLRPGMDELYRDQILEHYKRPHNFGRLEDADLEFEDTNPFCGDEQHVTSGSTTTGRVAEVAFEGKGCAISTAATSLLTDELAGQEPRGAAAPAEGVRPRPARDRHLGDADEVRDARPQGRQERQPRPAGRMGGRGRGRRPRRGEPPT